LIFELSLWCLSSVQKASHPFIDVRINSTSLQGGDIFLYLI